MPQLVKIYRFLSLIILLACLIKASTVRIMTYNLLNFEDENDRENDFRTIISIIEPDLIMVQEISGQTGFFHFKSDVLDLIEHCVLLLVKLVPHVLVVSLIVFEDFQH